MNETIARLDLTLRRTMFRAKRSLFGETPIYDAAERAFEIAPAETIYLRPSVFLPGQLDKVRELEPNTNWDIERRRAFGGTFERPPVKAWRFKNAALYRGSIYCRMREGRILPYEIEPPPSEDFPVLDIAEGALAGSYLGLRYFGHWMKDDVALSLLAEQYGEPISPTPPEWHKGVHRENHIFSYARFFDLKWRTAENVRFKTLVMFDDEVPTPHKVGRVRKIRERILAKLGPYPAARRLFIMRGVSDKGARNFINEEALADTLASEGFDVLKPAQMTVEEIAAAAYGAEMVVCMEGSHLNHALFFARDKAGFLAITPPERYNSPIKQWVEMLGMRYGFTVGDPSTDGFVADIDDVRRTIDLFAKEAD